MKKALVVTLCVFLSGTVAFADWNPEDGHKMHYPQLPDHNGWDVAFNGGYVADDWRCSETGYVNDIHVWGSWRGDNDGQPPPQPVIEFRIYSNDNSGDFSHPLELLWAQRFMPGSYRYGIYGEGAQGWFDPSDGALVAGDHRNIWQYNFEGIETPFLQREGEIYWLAFLGDDRSFGWKTSTTDREGIFEDFAVFGDGHHLRWNPIVIDGQPADMAFVINGSPVPVPGAVWLLGSGLIGLLGLRRKLR